MALCALGAGGSRLVWFLPAGLLDWPPAQALSPPWRWWTAAWVHWSPMHLGANLAGAAALAALGWVAVLPPRIAWACPGRHAHVG